MIGLIDRALGEVGNTCATAAGFLPRARGFIAPFGLSERLAGVQMSELQWQRPMDVFPTMETPGAGESA